MPPEYFYSHGFFASPPHWEPLLPALLSRQFFSDAFRNQAPHLRYCNSLFLIVKELSNEQAFDIVDDPYRAGVLGS